MTLGADIAETLPLLRAEAEGRMVDACTITAAGEGDTTFDPDTGTYTDAADTTVYTGKCEVQISDGLTAEQSEAGGTQIGVVRVTVKIPVSATAVHRGHVVTITAATNDPTLVGQRFTVIGGHGKTYATSRRLQVERITT